MRMDLERRQAEMKTKNLIKAMRASDRATRFDLVTYGRAVTVAIGCLRESYPRAYRLAPKPLLIKELEKLKELLERAADITPED
jgi:hypothetical protein